MAALAINAVIKVKTKLTLTKWLSWFHLKASLSLTLAGFGIISIQTVPNNLNALKNIIGDNRKNPSQKLLDEMAKVVESYPERIDDQAVLDRVAKNGLGQTVFISDLCLVNSNNRLYALIEVKS